MDIDIDVDFGVGEAGCSGQARKKVIQGVAGRQPLGPQG